MNYSIIINIIGWVLNAEAIFLTLPCVTALVYKEKSGYAFLITAFICGVFGLLLTRKSPKNKVFYTREGFVTVAACWIILSVVGAVPFLLSGEIPSLTNALFESVSGFSTTGASIVDNVNALSNCMLLWRNFTVWIGGMGVLVFIITILPLAGNYNMHLLKAESPGHSVGKLVPKVRSTAAILYGIYIALTFLQSILLLFGGMGIFDSVNIAFAIAGTGGFGIRTANAFSYSAYIQIVMTVFMILFGINFNAYFLLIMRKTRQAFEHEELKFYLGTVLTVVMLISFNLKSIFGGWGETIKHASFQVAGVISSTGFTTLDYKSLPEFTKTILLILMFVGSCSASTGGGIKISRVVILLKTLKKELDMLIHTRSIKKIRFCGRTIEHDTIRSINAFFVAYLAIFIFSILVISGDGFGFTTNFFAVASTLNNTGLSLESVGTPQSFSQFSVLSKGVLMFDMLAGRLEIFPILLLLKPTTWRKF